MWCNCSEGCFSGALGPHGTVLFRAVPVGGGVNKEMRGLGWLQASEAAGLPRGPQPSGPVGPAHIPAVSSLFVLNQAVEF